MVSLHRERFVVVHLCSSFPIDPHNFFKATAVNFGMRVRSWGSLPRQNFVKIALGQIYTKNYNFWQFFGP